MFSGKTDPPHLSSAVRGNCMLHCRCVLACMASAKSGDTWCDPPLLYCQAGCGTAGALQGFDSFGSLLAMPQMFRSQCTAVTQSPQCAKRGFKCAQGESMFHYADVMLSLTFIDFALKGRHLHSFCCGTCFLMSSPCRLAIAVPRISTQIWPRRPPGIQSQHETQ